MIEFIFISTLLTLYHFNHYIDKLFVQLRTDDVEMVKASRMELLQIVMHQYLNAVIIFAMVLYVVCVADFLIKSFASETSEAAKTSVVMTTLENIAPHYSKYFAEKNGFITQTVKALGTGILVNFILIHSLAFIRGDYYENDKGRLKLEAFIVSVLSFIINTVIYMFL